MKRLAHTARSFAKRVPLSATLLALAGCAGVQSPQQGAAQVRQESNPAAPAQRTITNFTPALRCMDDMLFRNGTRDITLMMEEMRDATQKVHVSTRDMMTSAISEMTRRSRAVRLSVFGSDQQNLQQALQAAQKTSPFATLPEYNLRGTISQLDEDVRRQSTSFGLQIAQAFGLRASQDIKFSVLAFDSAMVRTESMTLVHGVSSKNTSVIARRDSAAGDAQAGQSQGRVLSPVTVFSFSTARSEGTAQAARNLVELAAIELVGKLIRAPYWQCMGVEDTHPEVLRELDDWYLAMDEDERVSFFKDRMRERSYFDGALDASRGEAFDAAMAGYRRAMGVPPVGPMDLDFFRRFVTAAVPPGPLASRPRRAAAAQVQAQAPSPEAAPEAARALGALPAAAPPAAATAAAAPASVQSPTSAPGPQEPTAALNLFNSSRQAQGPVQLRVTVDRAGYVYCYAQDPQTQAIRRIFPNRFVRDPRVEPGRALAVSANARFTLPATHRYACVHAPREIYGELPPPLRWGDFEDIRLKSFDSIRQQFEQASGLPVSLGLLPAN